MDGLMDGWSASEALLLRRCAISIDS